MNTPAKGSKNMTQRWVSRKRVTSFKPYRNAAERQPINPETANIKINHLKRRCTKGETDFIMTLSSLSITILFEDYSNKVDVISFLGRFRADIIATTEQM